MTMQDVIISCELVKGAQHRREITGRQTLCQYTLSTWNRDEAQCFERWQFFHI